MSLVKFDDYLEKYGLSDGDFFHDQDLNDVEITDVNEAPVYILDSPVQQDWIREIQDLREKFYSRQVSETSNNSYNPYSHEDCKKFCRLTNEVSQTMFSSTTENSIHVFLLRAALPMLTAKHHRNFFVDISRDEETLLPKSKNILNQDGEVVGVPDLQGIEEINFFDPMLATGGSLAKAMDIFTGKKSDVKINVYSLFMVLKGASKIMGYLNGGSIRSGFLMAGLGVTQGQNRGYILGSENSHIPFAKDYLPLDCGDLSYLEKSLDYDPATFVKAESRFWG